MDGQLIYNARGVQNSEGGGSGDNGDSCADPSTSYNFRRPKFYLQPLSFTFETCQKI